MDEVKKELTPVGVTVLGQSGAGLTAGMDFGKIVAKYCRKHGQELIDYWYGRPLDRSRGKQ